MDLADLEWIVRELDEGREAVKEMMQRKLATEAVMSTLREALEKRSGEINPLQEALEGTKG